VFVLETLYLEEDEDSHCYDACLLCQMIQVNVLKCLSQYLTNLMYEICFTISFISCLYMFRAHVFEF